MTDIRFTLSAFIRDRAFALAIFITAMLAIWMMLAVMGVSPGGIAITECVLATSVVASLSIGYIRARKFYREALALSDQMDSANRLAALLQDPDFLEGRIAYELLDASSRASDAELTCLADEVEEYRRYVELWVHEMKAPLAAAKLMLREMHGERADDLKVQIERIERQVAQLLYYARSTSLSSDYMIREASLAGIVREACKDNAMLLIERDVHLNIEIPDDMTVLTDMQWAIFIISQILVNSAKYGAASIRFSAYDSNPESTDGKTVLEIKDDGIGISASDMPRIFDRAFTGANGRRTGSSTGMGLYLAALLCERLGCGITAASEEGKGVRMMISFPHDSRRLNLTKM